MNKNEIIERLTFLLKIDIDAVNAYTNVLEQITSPAVKDQIAGFERDHEKHIEILSTAIRDYGGEPPRFTRSISRYNFDFLSTISEFPRILSSRDTQSALESIMAGEEAVNKEYEAALSLDLPSEAKDIVEGNFRDEQLHLQYATQALKSRAWEQEKTGSI